MSRWLSEAEREKRDATILRLHNEGVPITQIAAQFKRPKGWVYERLRLIKGRAK